MIFYSSINFNLAGIEHLIRKYYPKEEDKNKKPNIPTAIPSDFKSSNIAPNSSILNTPGSYVDPKSSNINNEVPYNPQLSNAIESKHGLTSLFKKSSQNPAQPSYYTSGSPNTIPTHYQKIGHYNPQSNTQKINDKNDIFKDVSSKVESQIPITRPSKIIEVINNFKNTKIFDRQNLLYQILLEIMITYLPKKVNLK